MEHSLAQSRGWKVGIDYPAWGNNELYLQTIQGGYLIDSETPRMAYQRVTSTAARNINKPELQQAFFNIIWKGWLGAATPVLANTGSERGLPISCFGGQVGDSMYEIQRKLMELGMLSKGGGGTSFDFSKIRPAGSLIQGGRLGTADGVIPAAKVYDSNVLYSKQGKTRRGALALYLDAYHGDVNDWLKMRMPKGDINKQCLNLHHGVNVTDNFMEALKAGGSYERKLWIDIMKTRIESGEPYIMFIDNANNQAPFKIPGMKINASNLCTEIMLPTDEEHSFVCCISSMNLDRYDEWKNTNAVYLATMFLDGILEEFLKNRPNIQGIEDTFRFAKKSRAIGLGVAGYHSYLQQKHIPIESIAARAVNKQIFSKMYQQANQASVDLGKELGCPEWSPNRRNMTLLAVAPTRSNSKLLGGISQGIEPMAANMYLDNDAKGAYVRKNGLLQLALTRTNNDTSTIWDDIAGYKGSVQFLPDYVLDEETKAVFRTFKEINQLELIQQAADRQKYIDQGQSLNLAFTSDAPAKFVNKVHMVAWELGIKSLYYYRSESVAKADNKNSMYEHAVLPSTYSDCIMCEG